MGERSEPIRGLMVFATLAWQDDREGSLAAWFLSCLVMRQLARCCLIVVLFLGSTSTLLVDVCCVRAFARLVPRDVSCLARPTVCGTVGRKCVLVVLLLAQLAGLLVVLVVLFGKYFALYIVK